MPTITQLYATFEAKVAAFNAIPANTDEPGEISNPDFDKAVGRAVTAAWKIINTPAATFDDLLVKVRLGLWFVGQPPLDQLDTCVPSPSMATAGTEALAALREDLRRLRGVSAPRSIRCSPR
jgi:hypothetical protein